MGRNVVEMTGKRFGRLLITGRAGSHVGINHRVKLATWFAKCDCGKETIVVGSRLRSKITTSCGCIKKELVGSLGNSQYNHKNFPRGRATRNKILDAYKRGAKKANRVWALTEEAFDKITSIKCHYCGALPSNTCTGPRGDFVYNGIDRKNNDEGYTDENCVPCCRMCNLAKRHIPYESFKQYLIAAAEYLIQERQRNVLPVYQ